jgi:hypothetical protein
MQKKKKVLLFGIVLVLMIGVTILGLVGIFYYLTHPKPIGRFSTATPYSMSKNELIEFKQAEQLMSVDSTRYCEADLNGDGILDRAYAYGMWTEIYFNVGTDKEKVVKRDQIGSSGFTCIGCADINQDGKIDLVLGDPGDQAIDVLYNNGKGNFVLNVPLKRSGFIILEPNGIYFIVKDINQDNLPDIIYKSVSGNYYVLVNQGKG